MTPVRAATFRLDDDVLEALGRIKDRDGIPLSEQVRRALSAWIEQKGEKLPPKKAKK